MADGPLTLKLKDYAAEKLAAKAEAMGISEEELAFLLLDQQFFDYDDFTWLNGNPRDPMPPPSAEELEGGEDWTVLRPKFEAYVKAMLKDQA